MAFSLIPVLGWVGVGVLTAFGLKKGCDAFKDTKAVVSYHERFKRKLDFSESRLDTYKEKAQKYVGWDNKLKKFAITNTLTKYHKLLDKLGIKEQKRPISVRKGANLHKIGKMHENHISSSSAFDKLAVCALGGTFAAVGIFGVVWLADITPIDTTTNALKVSATHNFLTWLGGGSHIQGGLGAAGGAALLGGIAAALVIAITGFVWAKNARSKKYEEMSCFAAVDSVCGHIKTEKQLWRQVSDKMKEHTMTLFNVDAELNTRIFLVEHIFNKKGANILEWDNDEQESVRCMQELAQTALMLINTPPIFNDDVIIQDIVKEESQIIEIENEVQAVLCAK